MDNCVNTVSNLLRILKVKHTLRYVTDSVLSHSDHSSLLSISDTLEKYKIDSLAIRIDAKKLVEMPTPFIAQVKDHKQELFWIVEQISKQEVTYRNDENKKLNCSVEKFLELWTGIVLLVEVTNDSKEEGIQEKIVNKRLQNFLIGSSTAFFLFWAVIRFLNSEISATNDLFGYSLFYVLLKMTGLGVGVFLLWYEVDKFNPTLQKLCSGVSKKINCNAVLNSKYATLLNGRISLSLLSFSYFFGTLFFLIGNGFTISDFAITSYLSLFASLMVLISVYYQAIVIKQWCKFCIMIQAILVLEVLLISFSKLYEMPLELSSLPLLFSFVLIPIVLWNPLKNLLKKEKEVLEVKRGFSRIKHKKVVFQSLLEQSKKLENIPKRLGIIFKNTNAKYHIIKVCNPYCGPCAEAHPVLEKLHQSGKISLQILFMAKDLEDFTGKPVAHFLAIDSKGDQEQTQKVLADWYSSDLKDYPQFAKRYPINGALEKQEDKIKAMRRWCEAVPVQFTPTLFVNGYELPNEYSVADLKEVLH